MASRTLEITFIGDAKPVKQAFSEVDDASGKLSTKLGGLGSAFGTVASTAAGFLSAQVIGAAPGFLLGAAQAAADDEAATLRLEQALRNLGGNFDEHLSKVNAAIDAGQKLAFSDDDVRDSFQFLASATGDVDEALKRQSAAMDLARGANIPLSQATKMLGKLNEENIEVFKKLGIEIGENATEADALAAVQQKFGGQAEAYAKSTAGQFAQAKLAMGEIVESIGAGLLPILTKLGTTLAANLPKIQAFVGELGEKAAAVVGPALQRITDGAGRLAEFFVSVVAPALVGFWEKDLAPKVEVARELFGKVAGAVGELASTIADRLEEPLMRVVNFVAEHKEIWAAAAIVIGGVLVGAFTAWAVAAGAAALATIAAAAPVIAIGVALTALVAGIIWVVKNWDELTAKYPALGAASDAVKAKFEAFTGWITGTFVPAVQAIYTAVKDAVDKAVGWVRDHWDEIRAIIEPALKALGVVIETQWKLFQTIIETAFGVIKGVVDTFMGVFTGDWERAWGGVKQIVGSVWEGIKGVIETAITGIKDLAPNILEAGQALAKALLEGIKSALSATAGFAGDVAGAVLAAVKEIINSQVIDRINRTLEFSFDTRIPGIGTIHIDPIDIPHLAAGGIVTRPTLALIGEAGPEAVVPLRGGSQGLGPTVELHIHGNYYGDPSELAQLVRREFERAY